MNPEAEKIRRCVDSAVQKFSGEPGPLLEILHAVQNELGCVPPEAVPRIAEALNLSRAEVHGVVSFYHHFREHAPGRYVVQLCRAEACQSMNARALEEFVRGRLRLNFGETTPDGRITLEPVYCLGNCACAPAAMLDGAVYGRLDGERVAALLDTVRSAA
jgi:formate dehydrogenase subunit gamma